jgi:acetolactate synthase I/II/III large subunit
MKLSDYVARFLAEQGIRHVFAVSGGASLHLIHSVADTPGITFVCPQHEQAGAMAADGYARVTGNLGAAIGTSGPGATNMLTGVCCAYYDSVPVIYIAGQVATFRMRGDTGVRQIGFQETDAVDIFKPITKYSVQIDDPRKIRFELEKACYLAKSGRPGPVFVAIPDDLQREQIAPDDLETFTPAAQPKTVSQLEWKLDWCIELIENAKRPVVILGWGIRLARAEKAVKELINRLGFPVVPTWAVADLLPADHPLYVGTFGTHGTRYANFAVQNADLVLSVGSRLDTKATGSPMTTFAREAKKIVVDIDPYELGKFKKFGMEVELLINTDAEAFLQAISNELLGIEKPDISAWLAQIAQWKRKYPICPPAYYEQETVNPYVFVKVLSEQCIEGDEIFVDTGCAVAWMMQAFDFKANQRLYHDCNNTAMGWALPASIAACFALDKKPVICVTGDGSLQMNIQELATVIRHQLPIKIFLINNHGHSMIQQTQDQWLGSRYLASSIEGGLAFPNFIKVAEAYGYRTVNISKNCELNERIQEVLTSAGAIFCNVEIKPEHRVIPQVKFGRPNEDPAPLLPRKAFFEDMIVEPLEASLHEPE